MDAPEVTPPEHIPPKVVSQQARRVGTEDPPGGALPMARPVGRLDRRMGGEFPVLEAFQNFLEQERQRSRRQMTMLGLVFLVAIGAVVGVTLVFGLIVYRGMEKELSQVQHRVEAVGNAALERQHETQGAVEQALGETAAIRQALRQGSETQTRAIRDHQTRMETMRRRLIELESENTALADDLHAMREVVPSLAADMGLVVDLLESLSAAPLISAPPPVVALPLAAQPSAPRASIPPLAPVPSPASLGEGMQPLRLALADPDGGDILPWAVLIPE